MNAPERSGRHLLLRNRGMSLIWLGQTLSQVGTRMYQITLVWWIITHGGSGKEVGLFMVLGALPSLLLVKAVGRTVDAAPSKRVLVICDLLSFALVAFMAWACWTERLSLAWVFLSSFLVAAFQAFFDPALNKAVAELVDPKDLEEAVSLQSSTQSLASFGGAMAGALLIDRLGIPGVVALNALSYLVSAGANALILFPKKAPAAREEETSTASAWAVLRAAPWLKQVLFGFGFVNFFLTPILVILPLYAKESLGGGATLLGALEAALWLGLLAGTLGSKHFTLDRKSVV